MRRFLDISNRFIRNSCPSLDILSMSNAHKPTFHPAVGSAHQGGYRYHVERQQKDVRELSAHTKIKYRQTGQGTQSEIEAKDLKAELLLKERIHLQRSGVAVEDVFLIENGEEQVFTDGDESLVDSEDESEDDDAELMRELENIRREKEEEKRKREMEADQRAEKERSQSFMDNPLLSSSSVASSSEYTVKRRWDDDVVFRNQARDEPKEKKRFVNDTIRNDFHQKFMKKYIH